MRYMVCIYVFGSCFRIYYQFVYFNFFIELFSIAVPNITEMPQWPVFVSALSSNHFEEGVAMIKNVNSVPRKKRPEIKFILYDIGLEKSQIIKVGIVLTQLKLHRNVCFLNYILTYLRPINGYQVNVCPYVTHVGLFQIKNICDCEVRQFPFASYPNHVRLLNGYSWKPLIIQVSINNTELFY